MCSIYRRLSTHSFPNINIHIHTPISERIECVLFGLTGTVFSSHGVYSNMKNVFDNHSIPVSDQFIKPGIGMRKDIHIKSILETVYVKKKWKEMYSYIPSSMDSKILHEQYIHSYMYDSPFPTLLNSVSHACADLKNNDIRIACTSSHPLRVMNSMQHELKSFFNIDCFKASDEYYGLQSTRPRPFMIHDCLRVLDIYPPKRAVKVDSTLVGIKEGKNAGCWTIGMCNEPVYGFSEKEMIHAGADFVIDDMSKLNEKIEIINDHMNFSGL